MEIDFLGLNSTTKYDNMVERNPKDAIFFPITETTGGVETSLSLSTTGSPSCHTEILNFYEKRKWAEIYSSRSGSTVTCNSTEQPPVFHSSSTTKSPGFLYNLNDKSTELSISSSHAKGAENSMCIAGKNVYPRLICTTTGYTPTVAMARRATLARFLEQRLHRMNRARASHLMGMSLNVDKGKSILQR